MFDIEEFEEGSITPPYFVMLLLQGSTLQDLIGSSSPRLTVERCVQIIFQVCRSLQASHGARKLITSGLRRPRRSYQIGQAQDRLPYKIEGRTAFIDQFGLRVDG